MSKSKMRIYVEELSKILNPISFYVWKCIDPNDTEDNANYIHFRILFNELTNEQHGLIITAGNLKFVYSIDMIVDVYNKKYLFIKITELQQLLELKELYEEKLLETTIHLDYIKDKINKYK